MSLVKKLAAFFACTFSLFAVPPAGKSQHLESPDQTPQGLAKSDWQSIRAAYEAGRHEFKPIEGGWQARNPGQQWTTKFDGRGFITQPREGAWSWGLELESYGYGERATPIGGSVPAVKAEGQRLSYQWDGTVQEWWLNDQRGLEHGYTLAQRPTAAASGAPLTLLIAARGTLVPQVAPDGLGVLFQDQAGATVLNYTGLKVWDADGKVLTSRFEAAGAGRVRLLVEESTARYPITIDPIAQQAYVKVGDAGYGGMNDQFGSSVAVSGDIVVVGAPYEDSSTTGVNSTPDEGASDAGAAYVFVRSGTVWSQQAYLKASQVNAGDLFGNSVAVSDDTVVVGSIGEDSSTTGSTGTHNELASAAGAAYVFVRSGAVWSQQAYLKASQVTAGDNFGVAVAVSGDTVVVGAYGEDSSTTGVNNTPNESATDAGAAYVFVRSGTVWSQQAYLKASQLNVDDWFGRSVAVSGGTVVVGALFEDSSTTGINSTPNEGSSDAGAAYVFVRSGTVWSQQAYLKASQVNLYDQFGFSVAVSGDTVVVGAGGEDSSTTGINNLPNEGATDAGAAYVFVRNGTVWSQQAYLKASQITPVDNFGTSVAVSGDTVVVGARNEDSSTTGINSTPNEFASAAGAAYVFVRNGTVWSQQAYLKASQVNAGDNFGNSVAVSGDMVLVGALQEDGSTEEINGTPDEGGTNAGAAYMFVRSGTVWSQQAYAKPSDTGFGRVNDQFGSSVAVSGDTVVVGAYREDSSTTGINSTPNEGASAAGAAYVFVRSGTVWSQQAYLKASQVTAGDYFGYSVAVSGDTVVVGAYGENSSTTGINSIPNEGSADAGAAYVFVRSGEVWSQQAYLKASHVNQFNQFGCSVAVSGDTVVVGAPGEASSTTGINSTPNEGAADAGAAYVFVRSGAVWSQQAYLKASQVTAHDWFGFSVAVSGDTVVIGAYGEDSGTKGINSTPDEEASAAGAAYVFVRSGTVWSQQAYLKASQLNANDWFGRSVAVSGGTVVVGAIFEDSSTTGINSTPNEGSTDAGAAYVFVRSGTVWSQQAYLKASQVTAGDYFGYSVAVSDDTVVVGAYREDSSTTGINSTPSEGSTDAGAAYVFVRSGTVWGQQAYLKASEVTAIDYFGCSVAVSGDTVVVGAYGEDSSTTGINSTPNEADSGAGAAYIFTGLGPEPEMAIEQPAGTGLTSGVSSISHGAVAPGSSSAAKTFTVKNTGDGALTIASVGTTGGNAGDFAVNTAGMLTSLPALTGSTTFTVTFTALASGSRTTTLRILSDDSDEGTFDITLTGTGLSFIDDSDGDGLSDASEFNMAPLGFDWQVSQPALVNNYYTHANGANLYTPTQVQTLHVGVPLIQRSPAGVFTLTIGVEKSTTLQPGSFGPFPMTAPGTVTINGAGKLEFQFTVPDNAAFFRLQSQ